MVKKRRDKVTVWPFATEFVHVANKSPHSLLQDSANNLSKEWAIKGQVFVFCLSHRMSVANGSNPHLNAQRKFGDAKVTNEVLTLPGRKGCRTIPLS